MADRVFYKEFVATEDQVTDNQTFQDAGCSLTFTPEDNSEYVFFCSAMQQNSSSSVAVESRIFQTTDSIEAFLHVRDAAWAGDYRSVFGLFHESYGVSPGSKTIRWEHRTESTNTSSIKDMKIIALKLTANDEYAESLTEGTKNATTFQSKVLLNFTPGTEGDYLIIMFAQMASIVDETSEYRVRGSHQEGVVFSRAGERTQATTDEMCWMGVDKVSLTASENNFDLEYAADTLNDTVSINNARVLALRLDDFDQNSFTEERTTQSVTSTSYQTELTNTFTPNEFAEYLTIFTGIYLPNTGITTEQFIRGRLDNVQINDDEFITRREEFQSSGPGHGFAFFDVSELNTTSHTFDLQHKGDGTEEHRMDEQTITSLQLRKFNIDTVSDRFSMMGM